MSNEISINNRIIEPTDGRILDILARNCRVSDTAIAQAVHISKDTVAYRVSAMEKQGLIQNYLMFIDGRRLGFTRYHILIHFEGSFKDQRAVFSRLSQVPFVVWINTFIGRYDLQVIVDALDSFHLSKINEEVLAACQTKIRDYSILACMYDLEFTNLNPAIEHAIHFEQHNDASFSKMLAPRSFPAPSAFDKFIPEKRHVLMLQALTDNPRSTISELADKVDCDRLTARSKIEELIRKGVILSFGCISNLSQLGFVTYYLLVRMKQGTPEKVMRRPFLKLRNVFYAGRMIGDYDLIAYINARSPQELTISIQKLRVELGEYMLHYDLLVQDEVHYWKHFAPGMYAQLLSEI